MVMAKLIYGIGINDADYNVRSKINGLSVKCEFYTVWHHMLERCYSPKSLLKHPSYLGCTVSSDWLVFSAFMEWMERQQWKCMEIDKDLLFVGNKVYSAETCVFVDRVTNVFVIDRAADRGEWPLGVSFKKSIGKFSARCQNPFTKKREHLGYFNCPNKAHEAWKRRKHELACQLAGLQTDVRVAEALRNRYKTTVQRQLTE